MSKHEITFDNLIIYALGKAQLIPCTAAERRTAMERWKMLIDDAITDDIADEFNEHDKGGEG